MGRFLRIREVTAERVEVKGVAVLRIQQMLEGRRLEALKISDAVALVLLLLPSLATIAVAATKPRNPKPASQNPKPQNLNLSSCR